MSSQFIHISSCIDKSYLSILGILSGQLYASCGGCRRPAKQGSRLDVRVNCLIGPGRSGWQTLTARSGVVGLLEKDGVIIIGS